MILFRKYDPNADYHTLQKWWEGHGAHDVRREILPADGWIAHSNGVEIAASFFYHLIGSEGGIGIIEWTTTNPSLGFAREKVEAVKGLYERIEVEARSRKCVSMLSFVTPDSWERRTMGRMGYATSGDAKPHMVFAKPL